MSARTNAHRMLLWLCSGLLLAAPGVRAQDVELRAVPGGRQLPAAYFQRIQQNPNFFEIDRGWTAKTAAAVQGAAAAVVQGTLPVAVVQVLWADSPEPWITPQEIQRVLFDGPNPDGTLTEFYREISGGRLNLTGRVSPWVRTAIGRAETVGTSYGLGAEAKTGVFLMQALAAADDHIDFAQFDNNGPDGVPNSGDDDGFVDAVAFQFIESSASCGGDGIWPHRAGLSSWGSQTGGPYATRDLRPNGQPVLVNGYIIQSTVECGSVKPLTASVIAHELGHVLGLPDLYHRADGLLPFQRRWVVGCWTLMAAGSWGCGDGSTYGATRRPTHMGPWEKSVLGWIDEEVVGSVRDREYVLQPVQTSGRSLRVPLGPNEYLQIEYRPRLGFDVDLPASGVLIYHIDLTRPFFPQRVTDPRIYRIALVEADGDSALVRTSVEGGNRGVGSDAWAVSGSMSFSSVTAPALRRNSGLPSTVTIHSITVAGGVARVRLSTAAAPALLTSAQLPPTPALNPFSAQLRAAGGALPYQWAPQAALPRGLTVTSDADSVTIAGTPLESGAFSIPVRITDALGTVTTATVLLNIGAASFPLERLLQPFTRSSAQPPSADEQTYLDLNGNRNGRYDVGDLRRQLRTQAAAR